VFAFFALVFHEWASIVLFSIVDGHRESPKLLVLSRHQDFIAIISQDTNSYFSL